jgi:hypothetical protein
MTLAPIESGIGLLVLHPLAMEMIHPSRTVVLLAGMVFVGRTEMLAIHDHTLGRKFHPREHA